MVICWGWQGVWGLSGGSDNWQVHHHAPTQIDCGRQMTLVIWEHKWTVLPGEETLVAPREFAWVLWSGVREMLKIVDEAWCWSLGQSVKFGTKNCLFFIYAAINTFSNRFKTTTKIWQELCTADKQLLRSFEPIISSARYSTALCHAQNERLSSFVSSCL